VVTAAAPHTFGRLEAWDEAFRGILLDAERAAGSEASVLVTGETGTGKELLARAIHHASPRRAGPFVPVDCAGLAPGLIAAELFGHRRGAFSGAERERVGRFEAASRGTLFLDHVDELDLAAQAQLLRAVEAREVLPLGESRPRPVDFRLIASAGPDLGERVAGGGFRTDLFYRLRVVELALPPLRSRPADVPLLAARFLEDAARRFAKPLRGFSSRALEVLREHDWPGNARELQAAVESAAAAARGETIAESDLPVHVRIRRAAPAVTGAPGQPEPPAEPGGALLLPFAERVAEFQRTLLLETLGRNLWSYREAARELGLERHQLKYLCAKHGIRRCSATSS
jgi:DNA-binding NtrC family response regulator